MTIKPKDIQNRITNEKQISINESFIDKLQKEAKIIVEKRRSGDINQREKKILLGLEKDILKYQQTIKKLR